MTDREFMLEALALARRAWGRTTPNPMVGAVVVHDGRIVGRGFHVRAGKPHAEPCALSDAGKLAKGATLYVNLEPCSTYGRMPPCTEAIKAAGVARVVIGCMDPNPAHAGRGIRILQEAGIAVTCGVEEAASRELNKAFFHWVTTGKPYVVLKLAMTLDGKIATREGQSQWITGSGARSRVQELRRWADGILVSGETLRSDRPQLTVREPAEWPEQPRRLIASRSMTLEQVKGYFPSGREPEVYDIADWEAWLRRLGESDLTALLIEGGGELASAALRGGAVDEVEFHIAPKILGGKDSRPVVAGWNPESLADALPLTPLETTWQDTDLIYRAKIEK